MSNNYPQYGEMSAPGFDSQQNPYAAPGNTQPPIYHTASDASQPYVQYASQVEPDPAPRKRNTADMVITIILLVVGLLVLIFQAAYVFSLPNSLKYVLENAGLTGLTVPNSANVTSVVVGALLIILYMLALAWSALRIRAKKLSFFIPLVAGIIAVIVVTVATYMIITQVIPPEKFNDPEFMKQLQEKMSHKKH